MFTRRWFQVRVAMVLGACLAFAAVGCGGGEMSEDELATASFAAINTNGGTPGGQCTVTEGEKQGKTGTYDEDGWCCVEGGTYCVECGKPGGPSTRCKDGHGGSVTTPWPKRPAYPGYTGQLSD